MSGDTESVIVDTSVVSILSQETEDVRLRFYREKIGERHALISFQTLEELLFGLNLTNWGKAKKQRMRDRISRYQVVWPDRELIDVCAGLRSKQQRRGRTLAAPDAWIAATALRRQCPLASDDRDFRHIPGLRLIQPH